MEKRKISILRIGNLQRHGKKIIKIGICGLLLWLVPSSAHAHDFGPILTIGWGIIVLLQLGCWAIMLVEKKQELEAKIVLSSAMFVGILLLFWWILIFLLPPLIEYILGGSLDNTFSLFLYFFVLPLVAAHLVARALYQKFRESVSTPAATLRNEDH